MRIWCLFGSKAWIQEHFLFYRAHSKSLRSGSEGLSGIDEDRYRISFYDSWVWRTKCLWQDLSVYQSRKDAQSDEIGHIEIWKLNETQAS